MTSPRSIEFFVPGAPKPQPRPSVTMQGGIARVYYKGKKFAAWKRDLASALHDITCPGIPSVSNELQCPVSVSIEFVISRPKHHSNKSGLSPSGLTFPHPVAAGDVDNYAKTVLDCMTDAGIWADDGIVTRLVVTKRWADRDEAPGVHVQAREME